jgi:hypothetical protein
MKLVFSVRRRYLCLMRRTLLRLFCVGWLAYAWPLHGDTGRILKVLPEFLDLKGRTSLSPSLYERDAYQAVLRDHPSRREGIRFYVQWHTKGAVWEPLIVRLELRGAASGSFPKRLVVDTPVENTGSTLSHWVEVTLTGDEYRNFGGVTAWRATLWEGRHALGSQQSFLW